MRRKADVSRALSGLHSLTRLLPFAKPYTWQFIIVFVLVVIYNATNVLQPYLVKVAIDTDIATKHPQPDGLMVISWLYIGVVILGLLANFAQIIVLQYAGQNIIRAIRFRLFTHIESQAMSFFDKNALGRLVTNVSSDTETVSQFFTQFFLSIIRDGLSVVMIVVAMFELDVQIAALTMIIVPIIFLVSIAFRKKLRDAYQTTRTRLSNIVAFLAENLAGMRIIQIFHQEGRQQGKFEELNKGHLKANVHEYTVSVMFNRVLELLGNAAVAGTVYVGGGAVLRHVILFGTLYAFTSYIRQFFQPINSITQQWNTLQSSMVAAERIGRVLQEEPAIKDRADVVSVGQVEGRIEFRHVSFGYNPDESVLRDISFTVEPGHLIGFVGATGAGKSSIMSLLARFYEVDEGAILLDGVDIRDYAQKDLHHIVGLVQQEVNLFTGTVADNIRLFRRDISMEDVVRAAMTVGAHEVIERLPDGYDSKLVAKGANLSMGQRQLISFARIVAQNPSVLILDEATANLDSQTEELVQKGLAAVAENRTTLVIAHRLSTIAHADHIIVLDRGEIMEQGTHDELVRLGGLYAELAARSGVEVQSKKQTDTHFGKTRLGQSISHPGLVVH